MPFCGGNNIFLYKIHWHFRTFEKLVVEGNDNEGQYNFLRNKTIFTIQCAHIYIFTIDFVF